jgi:hypothetical protein
VTLLGHRSGSAIATIVASGMAHCQQTLSSLAGLRCSVRNRFGTNSATPQSNAREVWVDVLARPFEHAGTSGRQRNGDDPICEKTWLGETAESALCGRRERPMRPRKAWQIAPLEPVKRVAKWQYGQDCCMVAWRIRIISHTGDASRSEITLKTANMDRRGEPRKALA